MLSTSLPPGIAGRALGHLTIRLLNCSVSEPFSHVSFQFWGNSDAIHISLTQGIQIPLIGNLSSVDKYFQDASPLAIQVMGGVRQIGLSSVCLPSLANLMQGNGDHLHTYTCQFPLDVLKSEMDRASIGSMTLEMSFHMAPVQNPSIGHASFSIEKENHSKGLLDELLDLCSDDMTAPSIPTLGDSFNTSKCPDPFNSWISRMEKQASSPPPSHELTIQADAISISTKILALTHSTKAGTLVLKLSTKPSSDAVSIYASCHEELSENTNTSLAHGSCEPHPVSMFLSNFAQSTKYEKEQTNPKSEAPQPVTRDSSTKPKKSQHDHQLDSKPSTTLQPIRPPPLWTCIVVSSICISTNEFNNLRLKMSCSNAEPTAHDNAEKSFINQCSWQFSLKDRNTENVDAEIVLADDGPLNAIAHAQFNVNANRLKDTINVNRIPNIIESGCFDIVDSDETRLGIIHVEFCVGTLRQIRLFPQLCKLAMSVQRWWRKVLTKPVDDQNIAIQNEECSPEACNSAELGLDNEIHSSSFTSNICDAEHPESHGYFHPTDALVKELPSNHSSERTRSLVRDIDEDIIGSSICMQKQKSIETSSSPDSLFEEWSRQSTIRSQDSSRKVHSDTYNTKDNCGDITFDADSEKSGTDYKEVDDILPRARESEQVLPEWRDTSSPTDHCAPKDPPDDDLPLHSSPEVKRRRVDPPSSIHNDSNTSKVDAQGPFLRSGFKRSRFDSSSPVSMNVESNEHTRSSEKSGEATTNASCATPCQDMSSTENAFDNTPISIQENTKPETCEKGSSPLLVALRYMDAAVCTSPCKKSPTSPSWECPRESVAENPGCYVTAPEKGEEQKMTASGHKNHPQYNLDVRNDTGQYSTRSSVNQCLRLRSQARQNYSASLAKSPTLYQTSSLLKRNSMSSSFRSPVSSHLDTTDRSPPIKRLTNHRERIERIFSGKK